jgi:hypothetical protein
MELSKIIIKIIMFKYHGWIELRHSALELDWTEAKMNYSEYRSHLLSIVEELRNICEAEFNIKKINFSIIDGTNGIIAIHISGQENHYSSGIERMLDWIKEHAPLSHGLIYLSDSGIDDMCGKYKVLRLAQNSISELEDVFLSPFKKKIE